jgi:hypothetical protein
LYDTKAEALQAFWVNVVVFAKTHFHNTSYMVVEQNENGTETWFNDYNQEIDKPMTPEEIEAIINFANTLENSTPVETLP